MATAPRWGWHQDWNVTLDDTTKEEIRARADIVDVVGSYVQLKRAGTTYKGLCPFHREKTPSFNVDQRRQMYHCFGCDQGGDVFSFVMAIEGVDFVTAMKLLAKKVGVEFEPMQKRNKDGIDKDVLFRIHDELTQHYHQLLREDPGAAKARDYIKARKMAPEIIRSFMIGYAPDAYEHVINWGTKKGYTLKQLDAAGVIKARDPENPTPDSYTDRFRDRLMFPIMDELSRTIGYSGRNLPESTHPAKYINSPETMLFKKSRVLFGLDKARSAIVEQHKAVLCEGQIDVIRCHEAGVTHAVAAQGTAITEEHARILRRYADEVILVLDADTAGQNAALRAAQQFLTAGLTVSVVDLPEGEDPDSLVLKLGEEGFQACIAEAKSLLDFQIDLLSKREDPESEAGQMRIAKQVMETINHASSAVQRDRLAQQAADRLGLSVDALRSDLERNKKSQSPQRRGAQTPSPQASSSDTPFKLAPAATYPQAEVTLVEILNAHPETVEIAREFLPPACFSTVICRHLYEAILASGQAEPGQFIHGLDSENPELKRLATKIEMAYRSLGTELSSPTDAIYATMIQIWRSHLDRGLKALSERQQAEPDNEVIGVEIMQQLQAISELNAARIHSDWEKALAVFEMFGE
ncbi:MAG: DNA primase [Kiritimatiellia bacterium]|jgi:DNA primase